VQIGPRRAPGDPGLGRGGGGEPHLKRFARHVLK
jgi:hypothetical protein